MSKIDVLRANYLEQNTQFILLNKDGVIVESDDVLFSCIIGKHIETIHPFFTGIPEILTTAEQSFTCVHLNIGTTDLICDVSIKAHDKNFVIILSDFSKHYNSFQSLTQSRNETAIAGELIEIENYLLNKKQAFKDKFIANFNHELVAPILSVLTFSDALKKTHLMANQKEYLEVILSSADILKRMVNDIFDITKIETGDLDIINKRFSLKRLIKVLQQNFYAACKAKQIDLVVDYAVDMPDYVVSDKLRIHQILTNLIDNAIKYTNSGSITLTVTPVYRRARKLTFTIKVSDTGIGIPETHHEQIFERFFRLESNKTIPGNGLGLAITKELLTLMDGTIEVVSTPNNGSEFIATLRTTTPLKSPNKKTGELEIANEIKAKKEVLLVEDNPTDQLSIFKILAATKTYFIDLVDTAEDAIKLQGQKHYDIVLMNYRLNTLDGLEASKLINKSGQIETPVIILTGVKINENILKQYNAYVSAVLQKPFQPESLLEHIKLHLTQNTH